MDKYKIILLMVILIASLVILVDKIFTSAPIQIILTSGGEIITQGSDYYTLGEVMLLIILAFLIGSSATFIYYNSDEAIKSFIHSKEDKSKDSLITNLLKSNEKIVYHEIKNSRNNSILQNELVLKTNLSKVKITRIIRRLELKGLIIKERHGLTNKILLKREILNHNQ